MKKEKNYFTMYYFPVPVKNVTGVFGGSLYRGRSERVEITNEKIIFKKNRKKGPAVDRRKKKVKGIV